MKVGFFAFPNHVDVRKLKKKQVLHLIVDI